MRSATLINLRTIILTLLLSACSHAPKAPVIIYPEPKAYAIQKMETAKLSPTFIQYVLKKYKEKDRDDIVQVNLQGFLKKANYDIHYSKYAIKQCEIFMRKYRSALALAEAKFSVDKEAIVSLLWVETKFGDTMGAHAVPGVFFSLLQSDHPDVLRALTPAIKKIAPQEKNIDERVAAKANSKSAWALAELQALEKIYLQQGEKLDLRGSFAGAFGYPQFIPSSYLQWAQSSKKKRFPNLNYFPDAIFSIANYLHSNGWKDDDEVAQKAALFHYNHSEGYGNVILKLADAIQ